jgi:hypothetical protein
MIAGAASAQNPPAQQGPNNNAINTDQKNSDKPVAGRNSFTEGQAKSKIEDAGYSNVGELGIAWSVINRSAANPPSRSRNASMAECASIT